MAIRYLIENNSIDLIEDENTLPDDAKTVVIATSEEYGKMDGAGIEQSIVLESIGHSQACRVDIFEKCSAGSISVPDKDYPLKTSFEIGFLLTEKQIIFVDDSGTCADAMSGIIKLHHNVPPSVGRILFLMLRHLIIDDAEHLEEFEGKLESAEEALLQMNRQQLFADKTILKHLRELLRLNYYYEQLEDIGDLLEENANEMLTTIDARLFGIFARHVDQLYDRTRSLKEYTLQLLELQQTQIDIEQNHTMQWLTVVTSIFVPLTLVTSWYGMNFKGMPELDWTFGYPLVILICVAIVVGELIYFRRRKWL